MFKITGLDEVTKQLNELSRKAESLSGNNSVPLTEMLTPAFVAKHTRFANADEMFAASGFKIETQEDFASIPGEKWNEFIRSISSFADWDAMLGEAGSEWAAKKLGF
jgi:hypothetical protein